MLRLDGFIFGVLLFGFSGNVAFVVVQLCSLDHVVYEALVLYLILPNVLEQMVAERNFLLFQLLCWLFDRLFD